jgi:zinc protease
MVLLRPRFFRAAAAAALVLMSLAGPITAHAGVFDPRTFTLSNGLQVVVIENHRAPIVAQMVWYKVGAADEMARKSGIAHFLEHLMFKGTKTVPPGEFSKIVARNGGQDNAFTGHDFTAYFQRVARDKLELVMRLESDRMSNLTITDAEVLPERAVVQEERRSRTDNDPASQFYEQARASLYLNHPYGRPVIGWPEEIARLSTKDAQEHYRRYYAPNNAILVVAGDVTVAEVRRLAEKYYGPVPRRDVPPRFRPIEPKQIAARRLQMKNHRVRQPTWTQMFVTPVFHLENRKSGYALQILSEILGGGSTSRLYRTLVVEKKVAVSAGAWYAAGRLDNGEFNVSGSPKPGVTMADFEAAIRAELARVIKDGVTKDELELARNSLLSSAIYARDSLRTGPNVIGRALTTGRTLEDVEQWPDRIAAITLEDVNRAAREVLRDESSVTAILLPDPAG